MEENREIIQHREWKKTEIRLNGIQRMEESKDTFQYKEWKKTERQYKQRDNSLLRMKETERQFKT